MEEGTTAMASRWPLDAEQCFQQLLLDLEWVGWYWGPRKCVSTSLMVTLRCELATVDALWALDPLLRCQ